MSKGSQYFKCSRLNAVILESACDKNRLGFNLAKRRPEECSISEAPKTSSEPLFACKNCNHESARIAGRLSAEDEAEMLASTEQKVLVGNPHKYRSLESLTLIQDWKRKNE